MLLAARVPPPALIPRSSEFLEIGNIVVRYIEILIIPGQFDRDAHNAETIRSYLYNFSNFPGIIIIRVHNLNDVPSGEHLRRPCGWRRRRRCRADSPAGCLRGGGG